MIELKGVNFRYKNGKDVLKNISLEIKEGEFISIIGKNGSRKIYSWQNDIWFRKANERTSYN